MTFFSAINISLGLLLLSLLFQIYRRRIRKQRFKGLELKPNCLLTRYPIAFLAGKRSPFRFFNHWNDITLYLREHGYEVLVIETPTSGDRIQSMCLALKAHGGKVHLIADSSQEQDLRCLASLNLPEVASHTLIRNLNRKYGADLRTSLSPQDLKPLRASIQVFEVAGQTTGLETRPRYHDWLNRISSLMLFLHNRLFSSQTPVDAYETGEWVDRQSWHFEDRFLDLAISLAERDAQWSD